MDAGNVHICVFRVFGSILISLGLYIGCCWNCESLSQQHNCIQLKPGKIKKPGTLWLGSLRKKKINCRLASGFSAHCFIPLLKGNKYCQLCHYRKVLGVKDHHILWSVANLYCKTKKILHPKYLEPVLLQHWFKVLFECNNFFSFSTCNLFY